MRVRTVKRYYCDHCRKVNLSRFHMAKHEAGCTKNPGRVCRMHQFAADTDEHQAPMSELLSVLERGGLTELRKAAHNCPACILAAIVQFPWPPYPDCPSVNFDEEAGRLGRLPDPEDFIRHPHWEACAAFDFKKERDSLFATVNEDRREHY